MQHDVMSILYSLYLIPIVPCYSSYMYQLNVRSRKKAVLAERDTTDSFWPSRVVVSRDAYLDTKSSFSYFNVYYGDITSEVHMYASVKNVFERLGNYPK